MPRPRPNGNNNLPGKPPICPPLGGRLFRRGMRSPRPTSQFYRNLSSRVPILSMCARGAHSVFIIYYLLSIIYFAPQGHSRPRWCTDSQHPGKLQQKNSLTSPVNLYLPFISPGTLPRPKNAPPGRFCPAVRKTRGAGCSRPRWCTCPQYLGKSQQKNTPQLLARCLLWCTIGDSNPGPTD